MTEPNPDHSPAQTNAVPGVLSTGIALFNIVLFLSSGYLSFRGSPFWLIRILENSVCCLAPLPE